MIYYENSSYGEEGLNTHVMSYTLAIAMSNFLDRDLLFEYEIPSSTPPQYAAKPEFRHKFGSLLDSPRSNVSDLLSIPCRRLRTADLQAENRIDLQLVHSHFFTTDELRSRIEGTIIWDSFSLGRHGHTREELNRFDLVSWTHTKLSSTAFFFLLKRDEKARLLDSIKVRYIDAIEDLAAKIAREVGDFNAFHLRVGDFLRNYKSDEYEIKPSAFRDYARVNFNDGSLPILAATDALDQKEIFEAIFPDKELIFIDEFVFDRYLDDFLDLPFTDFNALTVLNQLLLTMSQDFIGTYRSTFTSIIHRMRQERYQKKDFNFWPDGRVSRQLSPGLKIVPDKAGFFDWNRYSAFAPDHINAAWMREWDHDLTSIDL
jgi:hypothetical protein